MNDETTKQLKETLDAMRGTEKGMRAKAEEIQNAAKGIVEGRDSITQQSIATNFAVIFRILANQHSMITDAVEQIAGILDYLDNDTPKKDDVSSLRKELRDTFQEHESGFRFIDNLQGYRPDTTKE